MEAKTAQGRFYAVHSSVCIFPYFIAGRLAAAEMEEKTAPLGCFISVYFNIGSLFYLYFIARILLIKREIFLAAVFFLITPR